MGVEEEKEKEIGVEGGERKGNPRWFISIEVVQILQIHQHISHYLILSSTGAMPEHSGSGGARASEGEENQEVRCVPLGPREAGWQAPHADLRGGPERVSMMRGHAWQPCLSTLSALLVHLFMGSLFLMTYLNLPLSPAMLVFRPFSRISATMLFVLSWIFLSFFLAFSFPVIFSS